ncbi:MAG: short-chain dehydrogenase [Verrucomicrobia bacterium]|nr:MAG: short-chain dehydrogenase [Verrucomicrobiota bacterium]
MKSETASVKETVLITGSTGGIGLHLAKEFARRRHPLVLVAPVESELQKVASELKTAGAVSVRIIAKDLEKSKAPQEIFDELSYERIYIDILVNNAGFSQRGKFWEIPIEHEISMLRLNIEAVLRLTKLFLPLMLRRHHGRVLNVASVAGFEPGPLFAVYHASKAFVLSLSEALATELEGTGVTATALCPGPTDTDLFERSGTLSARMFQKVNLMAPQDVAKAGYEGLTAGERVVVPGVANKIIVFSRRLLPEATLAKMTEKLYVDTPDRTREHGDREVKTAQG